MQRILLKVSYDGTAYVGWQRQINGVSIEEVLNEALFKLLHERVEVIGASRTDSGVHADGNFCVFDTESRIPGDKFKFALNEFLPDDIRIQDSGTVAPDFHPRKMNSVKTYEYRILNRKLPLPKERNYAYFYYYPLDVKKMQRAAACLIGEHDFKSFCSIRTQVEDTVREIYVCDIKRQGDLITLRISGNGFLYNMVRIIVGTLVKIGAGIIPESEMPAILEARDRAKAGPKAPACGLTLKSIEQIDKLPHVSYVKNRHWSYRLTRTGHITLYRCDASDFDRTLLRLTKHLSRNGIYEITVCDKTGRLHDGYAVSYFTYFKRGRTFVTHDARKDLQEKHDEPENEK